MAWKEQIRDHEVWETFDTFQTWLEDPQWGDLEGADEPEPVYDLKDRGKAVLDYAREQLEAADPYLVSVGTTLKEINTQINAIMAQNIETLVTTQANRQQVHANLSAALLAVGAVPPSDLDTGAAARVVEEHKKETRRSTDELDEKLNEIKQTAAELRTAVEQTEADQKILSETIGATTTDQAEKFTQSQADQREAAAEQREAIAAEAKKLVADLEDRQQQATKMLESMSITTTTSFYGDYAKKERRAANGWAGATVGIGIGAVVLMVMLFQGESDLEWAALAVKLPIGLLLTVVAGFAASEARGHRTQERRARHKELLLSSFTPFVANLEQDEINRLRKELVTDVLFVDPDDSGGGRSSKVTTSMSEDDPTQ